MLQLSHSQKLLSPTASDNGSINFRNFILLGRRRANNGGGGSKKGEHNIGPDFRHGLNFTQIVICIPAPYASSGERMIPATLSEKFRLKLAELQKMVPTAVISFDREVPLEETYKPAIPGVDATVFKDGFLMFGDNQFRTALKNDAPNSTIIEQIIISDKGRFGDALFVFTGLPAGDAKEATKHIAIDTTITPDDAIIRIVNVLVLHRN